MSTVNITIQEAGSGDVIAVTVFDAGTPGTGEGGEGGNTNLSSSATSTTVVVASDTGTDATLTAATALAAGVMTAAMFTKLNGIAAGATANDTDANLRARSSHTGTQAWSTITSTPTTLSGYGITDAASSTHAHGNITNAGAIGSTASLPVITGASGVLTVGSFGTTAGTFCEGNDSRLSNARTPTAHNHAASDINSGTLDPARLSFTKAQLDTAVSDGNVLYVGDVTSNATHTGDVTGATALTIANDAVTYAKMQNVSAASRLIGRGSAAGAGDPEEIVLGSGLTMTGTTLSSSGGIGGSTGVTDNRLLRSDGTGGATLQDTGITVDDSNNVTGVGTITASGTISGPNNTVIATTGTALTGQVRFADSAGNIRGRVDMTSGQFQSVTGYQFGSGFSGINTTGVDLEPGLIIAWRASTFGGFDIGLRREADGVLQINNGTAGTLRDLSLRNLTASGTLRVGGGTVVQNILSATATLDFPSIASNDTHTLTITVTGAVAGDSVFLGVPAGLEAGLIFCASVTAANTVTVRMHNSSGGSIDPASGTFRATVIRF